MWRQLLFILPLVLSTHSIRVPVDISEQNATEIIPVNKDQGQNTNVFYISDDAGVDSYLIPPDPHRQEEPSSDTPATYLQPPAQDRQSEYYIPTETAESEWLPIQAQSRPTITYQRQPKAVPIILNPNFSADPPTGHILDANRFAIPIPSTHLEPPPVDAVNEFIIAPEQTELPDNDQNQQLLPYKLPYADINVPVNHQLQAIEPTLALHLVPPQPQILRNPTKLYPKKYTGGFKPLPIPVSQFAEDNLPETPKAKPVNYFKPIPVAETDELPPSDEKNLYHYLKVEHQRKLKGEEAPIQPHQSDDGATQETYGGPTFSEQETSETNYRYPGRNVYPAPLRQAAPAPPPPPRDSAPALAPAPDGRTEFRMHGMKGPHSYQFGYDTGKGKNRQFRYEERDNDGLVHGHYGYMDKNGKLRVVNYSAHPEYGFRAEEPQEKE